MDITLILGIMRRHGWFNGARLMEIWFSRPANAQPERGEPETATSRTDRWVLTFQRVTAVCREIVSSQAWCNEAAHLLADKTQDLGKGCSIRVGIEFDLIGSRAA